MRILHTSDLHLGEAWQGRSREDDETRILAEILVLCKDQEVDLLLITGDVFGDGRREQLPRVARRFLRQLAPHLEDGLRVFLLRGNHDWLPFFSLLHDVQEIGAEAHSRLVVAAMPGVYPIPGSDLQVVAMPYLDQAMLLEAGEVGERLADQQTTLNSRLVGWLRRLDEDVVAERPAIFAAHLLVGGAQITPDREVESHYSEELCLDRNDLPHYTCYNALGHIHLSQPITGALKPTWYAGAADRHNLGEMDYEPQVLLVEVPPGGGGEARVTRLSLTRCTPFVRERFTSTDEVQAWCAARPPGVPAPLGQITLAVPYADAPACREALVAACRAQVLVDSAPPLVPAAEDQDPTDVDGTVRRYLARAIADEARHSQLLAAWNMLWQGETP